MQTLLALTVSLILLMHKFELTYCEKYKYQKPSLHI